MKYKITEYTTKRGSKGLILNVADAPVVSMRFQFRAGYRYVKDYGHKSQVAHVLEHVASGSNGQYPNQMDFESVFTKNGAYHNAMTGMIGLSYEASCADFEWERILELMRDQVCHPAIEQRYFDSELGNVRSELTGNLSIAGRMLGPAVAQNMGDNNKTYPQFIESLDNIQLDDLIEHHQRTHTAENMRFVIAGDFTGKMAKLHQLLDSFDLPAGERFKLPRDQLHSARPIVIERQDVPGITFLACLETLRELTDEEDEAMGALNHILNGTLKSRIYGRARERGLLYYCSSSTEASKYYSEWVFGGRANNDNLPAVFDLMVDELKRVKRGEIDDQDLADAKSYALGRYRMGIQTAGQLAGYVSGRYFYDGVIRDYNEAPAKINGVTKERIVEQAREFFDANIWSIGLYGTTDQAMGDQLYGKLAKLFWYAHMLQLLTVKFGRFWF